MNGGAGASFIARDSRTFLKKEGYGQVELRTILEAARFKPMNTIYLIPFLLDDCEVPSSFYGIHYASHQIPGDFEKLLLACEKRRSWLNDVHGMKIEPLHEQTTAPALDEREATHELLGPLARGRTVLPDGVVSALPGQHVTVEHFQGTASARPITVFLSYVHEGEALMHRLETHLSSLNREGLISIWCDSHGGNNWAFHGTLNEQELYLYETAHVPIKRHIAIQGEANPYDPEWESNCEKRLDAQMMATYKGKQRLHHLWQEQNGDCPVCQQKITRSTGWHSHHILWRSRGGQIRKRTASCFILPAINTFIARVSP